MDCCISRWIQQKPHVHSSNTSFSGSCKFIAKSELLYYYIIGSFNNALQNWISDCTNLHIHDGWVDHNWCYQIIVWEKSIMIKIGTFQVLTIRELSLLWREREGYSLLLGSWKVLCFFKLRISSSANRSIALKCSVIALQSYNKSLYRTWTISLILSNVLQILEKRWISW